ncbi:MAG: phosphotransferase [Pseudomonadales bacterium]
MTTERFECLVQWVRQSLTARGESIASSAALEPIAADASFRHFFRIRTSSRTFIAVDSPPERENNEQYVRLSQFYLAAELRVPEVLDADLEAGFLLVNDLGTRLMHDVINEHNADALYERALNDVIRIQRMPATSDVVPPYERERLQMELSLFTEWLLEAFLELELDEDEQALVAQTAATLVDAVDAQPKVCVHRDFHSRNLVMGDAGEIGIVDFQDSLIGAYTYDPVSLLRDCYLTWPEPRIQRWAQEYHRRALDVGHSFVPDLDRFLYDFDLTGVQRHLKAVGIFARLHLRDGRDALLQYIAPVLRHLIRVSAARTELAPLGALIESRVLECAERRIERVNR